MNIRLLLSFFATILIVSAFSQKPTLDLTFTAINNETYVQLDSIMVMNHTLDCDTVLYWPDTVLSLNYVGIPETNVDRESFQVFQNYPNPVADYTTVKFFIPERDIVSVTISDILGRPLIHNDYKLERGFHSFKFAPGQGNVLFFTVNWRGNNKTISILNSSLKNGRSVLLEYIGSPSNTASTKTTTANQYFTFNSGDSLLYICYYDNLESGIFDNPSSSKTAIFQFAYDIPCPGTPTVNYEGQTYNTVQILSQCWLKENLNVGIMIPGDQDMQDNSIIEKHCYNNVQDSCTKYGGFYQWDEMMQYLSKENNQGICPPGWHLPTDEDLNIVEGIADSQYGIGDTTWNNSGYRGYDASPNMKTTYGWAGGENGIDLLGFSGMPSGFRNRYGQFGYINTKGGWWASSKRDDENAWIHYLSNGSPGVYRNYFRLRSSFGVRCIKD